MGIFEYFVQRKRERKSKNCVLEGQICELQHIVRMKQNEFDFEFTMVQSQLEYLREYVNKTDFSDFDREEFEGQFSDVINELAEYGLQVTLKRVYNDGAENN